jgi:enamine deaminase RidA (YjgF/YER057c/UK114 family)
MSIIAKRLEQLGIALPRPVAPIANYVGFVRTGNLLFLSGQLCLVDGVPVAKGKLGSEVTTAEGQAAARVSGINLLAQLRLALGDLDKVVRVVRLGGFISSAPDFLGAWWTCSAIVDAMPAPPSRFPCFRATLPSRSRARSRRPDHRGHQPPTGGMKGLDDDGSLAARHLD